MADPTAYDELINRYADEYDIDPLIFRRLINQESRFNPVAVSPKGATGIGQVMPDTARDPGYGVRPLASEDLTNPDENLRFSAEYLGAMLREFGGDYPMALAAYNAGPGAVKKYEGIPPFEETQNYVQTILGSEEILSSSGQVRPQARPERATDDQAEDKSYLDYLSDALPYLEAAQLTGAPQARFDPPGLRRPQRRSGDDALKRLGLASLIQ
jgi:hypothetical protein